MAAKPTSMHRMSPRERVPDCHCARLWSGSDYCRALTKPEVNTLIAVATSRAVPCWAEFYVVFGIPAVTCHIELH